MTPVYLNLNWEFPYAKKNMLPRTSGRWAFWPFSVITSFQLNYEFVPAPTTEDTGNQIIPLEEQG